MQISCNEYAWRTHAARDPQSVPGPPDHFEPVRAAGFDAWEPCIESAAQLEQLIPALHTAGLALPSLYVNSLLHDEAAAAASSRLILSLAPIAHAAGCRIFVTNPTPIQWGGDASKTDAQLAIQCRALSELGQALRSHGITLAYHHHDIELRHGAREWLAALAATDPADVAFCFDPHWTYRGSGDSHRAVQSALTLFADRIVEVHVRQSRGGVWTETFEPSADIDYPAIARALGHRPQILWTYEQAVESATPATQPSATSHASGLHALRSLL